MKLLNEIITNFPEWRCKLLDGNIVMYSRRFSGNTHHQLKDNFHSTFSSFTEDDKTIIVCCFNTYANIVIFQLSNKKSYKLKAATA